MANVLKMSNSEVVIVTVIITCLIGAGLGVDTCRNVDWSDSFASYTRGLSTCGRQEAIRGFYRRSPPPSGTDFIDNIKEAVCCSTNSPFDHHTSNYVYADWWMAFDPGYAWASCPEGFFLQGLWRSLGTGWIYYIEEGLCWKPANHPHHYGECYEKDVSTSFDVEGITQCDEGYYLTGFRRGEFTCQELHCLETFRCCKMVDSPASLESMEDVKTYYMDITQYDLAMLAYYLGYGNAQGCLGYHVGEDFDRVGDAWVGRRDVVEHPRCSVVEDPGYQRLRIDYGDWQFKLEDIEYGAPTITKLPDELLYSGYVRNPGWRVQYFKVKAYEEVTSSVTHTPHSRLSLPEELGIELPYTPEQDAKKGSGSTQAPSYTFGYETASKTVDSTGNNQTTTLLAYSASYLGQGEVAQYQAWLSKSRRTVPYTATVLVSFSTAFSGYLRYGEGQPGKTNYHQEYTGTNTRPSFNYTFGDANTPFFEDLSNQRESNAQPWMWDAMRAQFGQLDTLVDKVTSRNHYKLILHGQFEHVYGTKATFKFQSVPGTCGSFLGTVHERQFLFLDTHRSVAEYTAGGPAHDTTPAPLEVLPPEIQEVPLEPIPFSYGP